MKFNLTRRFSVASLLIIALISAGDSLLLSGYITDLVLDRESRVTGEFVLNVMRADGSTEFLSEPERSDVAEKFRGSLLHFTAIRDLQRINVYSTQKVVLWSTDASVIGQRFEANEELDRALGGTLVAESGRIRGADRVKPEHIGLSATSEYFLETYIPVTAFEGGPVLGVVELYKAPSELTRVIREGHFRIWLSALAGALLLFGSLFWIVRNAGRQIADQQAQILKAETTAAAMVATTELATAMAHNMRNPLASIRTTAELYQATGQFGDEDAPEDLIRSVDRMEVWLRSLISLSGVEHAEATSVDAAMLMRECFNASSIEMARRGIAGTVDIASGAACVSANRALLAQALQILLTNAIEATPRGGRIAGSVANTVSGVEFRIADSGPGIAPEDMPRLFDLFFTTKPSGMGVGLALARRAVERFGGRIWAESSSTGAVFIVELSQA